MPRNIDASFVGANYAKRAGYLNYLLANGIDTQIYGPGWVNDNKSDFRKFVSRTKLIAKTLFSTNTQDQNLNSALLADYDFKNNFCNKYKANLHSPISDKFLIELYSRSQISLGFLEVFDNHDPSKAVIQHLHLREFEAPMSGALYFTGHTEELEEMFTPDEEVVVYKNEHELVDKAKFYLSHPDKGEKIRVNARKRALAEHTYHVRYNTLFKVLGLK